jgi:hypothetical protein
MPSTKKWDESKVTRDESGRFVSGSGSSGVKTDQYGNPIPGMSLREQWELMQQQNSTILRGSQSPTNVHAVGRAKAQEAAATATPHLSQADDERRRLQNMAAFNAEVRASAQVKAGTHSSQSLLQRQQAVRRTAQQQSPVLQQTQAALSSANHSARLERHLSAETKRRLAEAQRWTQQVNREISKRTQK